MNEQWLPNVAVNRFENIDFHKILSGQRRYLCLDLDNTLLPQTGFVVSGEVSEKLAEIREAGLVEDICLISNVILPGRRVKRLYRLAQELGIRHVVPGYFWNRKPKAAPFLAALDLLGAKPEQVVMVGDQIFSDIVGANRLGIFTIWLEPMSGDHWTTLLTGRRRREKRIRQEMISRGLLGS
jgi:HAD superfamily phosphatase (TIGR01668 family)